MDFGNDEDETRDDYRLESGSLSAVDCMVFLVDASPGMRAAIQDTVRALANVLAEKIRSPRDLIGIIFYNVRGMVNDQNFKHIVEYRKPSPADARSIMALQEIATKQVKLEELCAHLDERGDPADDNDADFSQVIWAAAVALGSVRAKSVQRRLFIVTGRDDPTGGSRIVRSKSDQRLSDLIEQGAEVAVLPIAGVSNEFNYDAFYAPYVADARGIVTPRPVAELSARIETASRARRVLSSITMKLDAKGEIAIAVQVFSVRMEAKMPTPVYLDPETNDLLTSQQQWVAQDTADIIDATDLVSYMLYGGQKVTFTKQDLKTIKTVYPSGMQLLGFKPLEMLLPYHNVKPSLFVRPDEKRITGSSAAFMALLQRMNARGVFAVARMGLRDVGVPRLVALLAQTEKRDEYDDVSEPAGFNCIPLPYADDIREIPTGLPTVEVPDDAVIDLAKRMCKTFAFEDFTPAAYRNVELAKYYATLRAIALNLPEFETIDDDLVAPEPTKSRPLFEEFATAIFGTGYSDGQQDQVQPPAKRSYSSKGGASKKSKVDFDPDNPDFIALFEQDALGQLTVPKLKAYLRENGLAYSGTKAALIERICDHLTTNKGDRS
ncbi:unnamed protein product (mitochondrion) [Plasmodiophora brassicae]|uniref:SAP domain-containing protein n=1 Tax=Plasmodiophora brassicae TaxID=37360 RepID=A0A0G4J6I8_PLABS|nr:hypothetical protein PBRA_009330 [Plasmodiophora brassicae]SPQ99103.1 unnamed protein product [Plasmodiophora brassicae]